MPILHVSPDSILSAGWVGSIHEPMLQVRTWRLAKLGKCGLVHEYYLVAWKLRTDAVRMAGCV